MKQTSKEYAHALFSLALEKSCTQEYADALNELKAVVSKTPDYVEFLASPAVLLSERLQAIDVAFSNRFPAHIVSFVKLLCENRHISCLTDCIDDFFSLKQAYENALTITVYSSVRLTENQKELLCKKLETKYQKRIQAVYREDESLLGGIKIVMEDQILDGSIEKHLQTIKEVIKS